jgi:hypothetical protein
VARDADDRFDEGLPLGFGQSVTGAFAPSNEALSRSAAWVLNARSIADVSFEADRAVEPSATAPITFRAPMGWFSADFDLNIRRLR